MAGAVAIFSVAIVAALYMSGWNSAEHRQHENEARRMKFAFYASGALFSAVVIKVIFFAGI